MQKSYSFDDFTLDLSRGSLFRDHTEIRLRPKSFEVLKYLVQNPARLITKDELIEAVWDGTAVTDDSVVQCLKDVRRVLADTEQEFIRTVPRRGYIFEKDVRQNDWSVLNDGSASVRLVIEETIERDSEVISIDSSADIASRTRRLTRRKVLVAGVAAAILVILLGVLFYKPIIGWWFKPPSIAVMPIANATGDQQQDYISDGLTESIVTSFTRLNPPGRAPRLRVIALNTMFMFKDKAVEARSVGRELGADTVLSSRMFFQNGLRIFNFELINVADGSLAWSRQYSVEPNSPAQFLEIQNRIPNDIIAPLSLSLSDADRENLTRRYTQNPTAYDLFLKGRAEFRRVTPSGLRKSIDYYKQAIAEDAEFATAFWALGVAYRTQGTIDEVSDSSAIANAIEAFQKALAIDSRFAPAQNALRKIQGDEWNWKAIEKEGSAHPAWGDYLLANERYDEEIEIEKGLLAVAPFHPVMNLGLCSSLLAARRIDEAISQCERTLSLVPAPDKTYVGPESPWLHLYLAIAYSEKKMFSEAIAEGKKAVQLGEDSKTLNAELASIYAKGGETGEARRILGELEKREATGEYSPSLNIALIYCNLGEKESAFDWLERAFVERETRLTWVRARSDCDALHDDPRFADLISRIGLRP